MQICNSRGIPLVFLCDVVDRSYDFHEDISLYDISGSGLVLKAQAQMIHAVSLAQVPRITVVIGDSFGPTSFAMVRYDEQVRLEFTRLSMCLLPMILTMPMSKH